MFRKRNNDQGSGESELPITDAATPELFYPEDWPEGLDRAARTKGGTYTFTHRGRQIEAVPVLSRNVIHVLQHCDECGTRFNTDGHMTTRPDSKWFSMLQNPICDSCKYFDVKLERATAEFDEACKIMPELEGYFEALGLDPPTFYVEDRYGSLQFEHPAFIRVMTVIVSGNLQQLVEAGYDPAWLNPTDDTYKSRVVDFARKFFVNYAVVSTAQGWVLRYTALKGTGDYRKLRDAKSKLEAHKHRREEFQAAPSAIDPASPQD